MPRNWIVKKCPLNCEGYDDHELKELKSGLVVRIITCHHCFRIKSKTHYKKVKKRKYRGGVAKR